MSEIPERLLIPFSGQADAVDLCAAAATRFPRARITLLYLRGIGIRARFTPPLAAARALATKLPAVERLLLADAGPLLAATLAALPTALAARLGLRTMCTACQCSLLLLASLLADAVAATLVIGPREALGSDLDEALRVVLALGSESDRAREPIALALAPPSRFKLPLAAGERCALSGHHCAPELLDGEQLRDLRTWLADWRQADGRRCATALVAACESFALSS